MSLPRYSEYKPSGVEWLGDVPVHWAAIRLRFICQCLDGQRIPLNAAQRSDKLGDIPYWGANSIVGYVDEALFDEDLVLLGEDGAPFFEPSKSVAFFSQGKVWPNNHVHVLRPTVRGTGTFITYVLNVTDYAQFIDGSTRDKLTQGSMNDIPIPWPPIAEQTQIAAFLDRETAKIDELVAEQRRLMELLKEKRQAVISHAVTQGLNPDAPMKPSGIEWLGDVPATWEVPSLGVLISKAELGENHDSSEGNEGVPVMKMGNLDRGFIKLDKVEYLPEETEVSDSMILRDGDFLFNTRNSLDLVGKVAIWRGELSRATYNSNVLRISFNSFKVASREFMNYLFNSDLGLSQLRALAKGTTSVAAIYYKDLTSLRVMLPPAAEQHAIAKHLDDACAKFDTLTAEAQRAIDLLQERRTALISAAVTGQIDVRGIQVLPQ